MTETHLTKITVENDELVVIFPIELLKKLQFIENEYLSWEVADDRKTITIRRINFVDNSQPE